MEHEKSKRTPRNATAVVNLEKPQRSIKLTWEAPEICPKCYDVKSIPETGKHKNRQFERPQIIFSRLKTDTVYKFEISAIYDDGVQRSCMTEEVKTYERLKQPIPAYYHNISGTTIDQRNSAISNTTQVLSTRPDGFDKVSNMKMNMVNKLGREVATVSWDHPPGFRGDYEIIEYCVEVFELSESIFRSFHEYEKSPSTAEFPVKLGEAYTVKIQTTYEELDLEETHKSNSETTFYSRPKHPIIEWEVEDNQLIVSWGSSIGAEKFRIGFLRSAKSLCGGKQVIKEEEGEKEFKKMIFKIDKQVFRGVRYIVNVTAIGKLGRISNTTKDILIGNDWSPRCPNVSLNKLDGLHSVDISWVRAENSPPKYIVRDTKNTACVEVHDTKCTVRGLKAGEKYRFNIFAIYAERLDYEYRCTTDEITTNPFPDKRIEIMNVSRSRDHPDSELMIHWEKINGATEYRVRVKYKKLVLEDITTEDHYTVRGLHPYTIYSVGVSPGNEEGFGMELCQECQTALKAPEAIMLSSLQSDRIEVRWQGDFMSDYDICLHNADDGTLVKHARPSRESRESTFSVFGNKKYFAEIEAIAPGASSRKRKSQNILTVPPVKNIKTLSSLGEKGSLSTDVHLDWQKDEGSLVYEIEVRTKGEIENLLRVEDVNDHKYRCLQAGNSYDFRLRAVNSSGFGRWSEPKTIQLQNPEPPEKIEIVLDKDKPWKIANIKWDRPEGVTCFKVQITPSAKGEWIQKENCYTFQLGKPLTNYEITLYSGHDNGIFSTLPAKKGFQTREPQPPGHVLVNLDKIRP